MKNGREFEIDSFTKNAYNQAYEVKLGEVIWSFLNECSSIIKMETATKLGHPALEALAEELLDRFGDAVINDEVKRMCGRMTRKIMEERGFPLKEEDVKINKCVLFKTAAQYEWSAKESIDSKD